MRILLALIILTAGCIAQQAEKPVELKIAEPEIIPIAHASVMIKYAGKVVHIDPYGVDYTAYPKADLILITHTHPDHFNTGKINQARKETTKIIAPEDAKKELKEVIAIKEGETQVIDGIQIKAVPAYNIKRMRSPGQPYHPRGFGVGYVIAVGGKNIYIGGDTECVPEIKELKNIDVAFLPINAIDERFTMPPSEAAECFKAIKPKIAIPYH